MYNLAAPNPLVGPVMMLFKIYELLLLVRIVCSWVPFDRRAKWYYYLYRATEPVLSPFRRLLPPASGIDFSPIVAFMVIEIVKDLVLRIIW